MDKIKLEKEDLLKGLKRNFGFLDEAIKPELGFINKYVNSPITLMKITATTTDSEIVRVNKVTSIVEDKNSPKLTVNYTSFSNNIENTQDLTTDLLGRFKSEKDNITYVFIPTALKILIEENVHFYKEKLDEVWKNTNALSDSEMYTYSPENVSSKDELSSNYVGLIVKIEDYDYLFIRLDEYKYDSNSEILIINPNKECFMIKNFKMGKTNKFNLIMPIKFNEDKQTTVFDLNLDCKIVKL